jgi:hypothetical protein
VGAVFHGFKSVALMARASCSSSQAGRDLSVMSASSSDLRLWPTRRQGPAVSDDLPTARSTLRARYVTLLVFCRGGCRHQAEADLHGLVASGRGDVPLTALRFGCSNCGSDRTDSVLCSRDAVVVQPWGAL